MTLLDTIGRLDPTDGDDRLDDAESVLIERAERDDDWRLWLELIFHEQIKAPFAAHHEHFWQWVWAIREGSRPRPYVGIWPRGGGKSTSAELGVARVACARARRYGVVVSETQNQANDRVQNVAALLEHETLRRHYPEVGERSVNAYGSSRGWRRDRLRTESRFTLDALGLDSAHRGAKIEEDRPDFFLLDDLDGENDSPATVAKNVAALTRKILPSGVEDGTLAVLAIQNLPSRIGIFAQLAGITEEPADYLIDREMSGPIPALEDFEYREREDGGYVITHGTPTWEGQDVDACQRFLDTFGLSAFVGECQHDDTITEEGLYSAVTFKRCDPDDVPALVRKACWVDPAVTTTDKSDACAIQLDGIDADGVIYRLRSYERIDTPLDVLKRAIRWAFEERCDKVGIETDQGRDTWRSVYREALTDVLDEHDEYADLRPPTFYEAVAGEQPKAVQSKMARQGRMVADYERPGPRIVHVDGYAELLERALRRFGLVKPFDLGDAAYWSWQDLREHGQMVASQPAKGRGPIKPEYRGSTSRGSYIRRRR